MKPADLRRRDHPCPANLLRLEEPSVDPLLEHIDLGRAAREQCLGQTMDWIPLQFLLTLSHLRQRGFNIEPGNDQAVQALFWIRQTRGDFAGLDQGQQPAEGNTRVAEDPSRFAQEQPPATERFAGWGPAGGGLPTWKAN
jgi:hypothetical protein